MEIPRERGISKAKTFKGNYEAKLEFLGGGEAQTKKLSMGGVGIFMEYYSVKGLEQGNRVSFSILL